MNEGVLVWVTGLSNAGKTTISRALVHRMRENGAVVVHLDGDEMRSALRAHDRYSREERLELAWVYSGVCRLIVSQGVHVVCSTISMFHAVRASNRQTFQNYFEVWLRAPDVVLRSRDSRGVYNSSGPNDPNVAGYGVAVEEPENPDLKFDNDGSHGVGELADLVYRRLEEKYGKL